MSNNGIATSIDKLYSLNLEGDEKTGEEQRVRNKNIPHG